MPKAPKRHLRATEERFRTLVQFSFVVYWETDAQLRFTRQDFSGELADAPARGSQIGKTRWEVPYLSRTDYVAGETASILIQVVLFVLTFAVIRVARRGARRRAEQQPTEAAAAPVFELTVVISARRRSSRLRGSIRTRRALSSTPSRSWFLCRRC